MARSRERLPLSSISLLHTLPLPKDLTDSLTEALRLPSSKSSPRQLAPGRTPLKRKPADYAERAERYAMILQLLKSEPAKPLAHRRSPAFGGQKVPAFWGGEIVQRAAAGPGATRLSAVENDAPKAGGNEHSAGGGVGTGSQKIAGMDPPGKKAPAEQELKGPPVSHIDLTGFRRGGDQRPRLTEKPQNVGNPVLLSSTRKQESEKEVKGGGRKREVRPKDKRIDERSLGLGGQEKGRREGGTLGTSAGLVGGLSTGRWPIQAGIAHIESVNRKKLKGDFGTLQVEGGSPPLSPTTQEAALLAELELLNRQLESVRISERLGSGSNSDKPVAKRRLAYVSHGESGVPEPGADVHEGEIGGSLERRAGIDASAIEAFAEAVKATVGKSGRKLEAGTKSGRRSEAEENSVGTTKGGRREGGRFEEEQGELSEAGRNSRRRLEEAEGKNKSLEKEERRTNDVIARSLATRRRFPSTASNDLESRKNSNTSGQRGRLSTADQPKTPKPQLPKTPDSRAVSRRKSQSDGVSEARLCASEMLEPIPAARLRRHSGTSERNCCSAVEPLRNFRTHRSSGSFPGVAVGKAARKPSVPAAQKIDKERQRSGPADQRGSEGTSSSAAESGIVTGAEQRNGREDRAQPADAFEKERKLQSHATGLSSRVKAEGTAAHPGERAQLEVADQTVRALPQETGSGRDDGQLLEQEGSEAVSAVLMDTVPSSATSGANGRAGPDKPLCVFVRLSQLAGRRRASSVTDGRHVAAPEFLITAAQGDEVCLPHSGRRTERRRAVSHTSGERHVAVGEADATLGDQQVPGPESAASSFVVEWPSDLEISSKAAARAESGGGVLATEERARAEGASPERLPAVEASSDGEALAAMYEVETGSEEKRSGDNPEDAWGEFVGAQEDINSSSGSPKEEPEKLGSTTGWSRGVADEEMYLCAERARLPRVETLFETGWDSEGESRKAGESARQGGRARRGGVSGFWKRVETKDVEEAGSTGVSGPATDGGPAEKSAASSDDGSPGPEGDVSQNGASVAKLVAQFELLWAEPSARDDDVASDVKLVESTLLEDSVEGEAEAGLSGAEPVWVQWERELLETSSREQSPRRRTWDA
ncbi:hypothetical protein KFL_001150180 [Klebsormidium nitens]|uniref:Uncharacterized protein n=1 Tax=Klebsormidium nitens TaxID=105231 RepID=A0A1Y1I1B2_KLENI|nr:hypothetical protein KFL_001150180 [Klebsormidium nitens]|eukprot:GAQ82557.1 hypothetical protein KFL_001150180 [Klebsormidium nitens]